jgi:hypothetical protein
MDQQHGGKRHRCEKGDNSSKAARNHSREGHTSQYDAVEEKDERRKKQRHEVESSARERLNSDRNRQIEIEAENLMQELLM